MSAPPELSPTATEPRDIGLRARKKEATRQALVEAALELFADRGFDQTTVDDIAAVVDVAPRTFHRYFARKEDVLYIDAQQRIDTLRRSLATRPADEPILTSLRIAIEDALATVADHHDREALRSRVLADNPVIKAANLRYFDEWSAVIADHVATREGAAPDDPWPALVAQCVIGAVRVARTNWLVHGGDLGEHTSNALAMLLRLDTLAEPRDLDTPVR